MAIFADLVALSNGFATMESLDVILGFTFMLVGLQMKRRLKLNLSE